MTDRGLVVPQLILPLDPRSALEPDLAVLRPIHELWMVDLPGERVLVHRDRRGGEYRTLEAAGRGSAVTPLAFPRIQVAVDEILG